MRDSVMTASRGARLGEQRRETGDSGGGASQIFGPRPRRHASC